MKVKDMGKNFIDYFNLNKRIEKLSKEEVEQRIKRLEELIPKLEDERKNWSTAKKVFKYFDLNYVSPDILKIDLEIYNEIYKKWR